MEDIGRLALERSNRDGDNCMVLLNLILLMIMF